VTPSPAIRPFGDSALLVVFGDSIDVALNSRVHALAAAVGALRAAPGAPWGVPVPAYSSLLVPYDPERLSCEEAEAALAPLAAQAEAAADAASGEVVEIAVHYGGDDGPDLEDVAARHGLTPAEAVALHTGALYRVFMLGFAPGFAYLGPLPPQLVTPRRPTPRPRVPPGSVAIAGSQTGIYPLATPGGWHLLGRTDAPLWDPQRDPPALLRPGQFVRFVAR
jgi:KipI family sensor histidine kinase inhibitor